MTGQAIDEIVQSDVLIIGGGLAGTWAAVRATDFVENVVLVDKAQVSRSGASTSAAGVMLAPMPGDDLQVWMREIVERGDFLSDQDWLRILLSDQIERIQDMTRWGMAFERDEQGNIARIIGRGHVETRMLMFHGKKMMEKMREEVIKRKVKLVERVTITDLLTSDGAHPTCGRVVGAIGFDTRTGKRLLFEAKATIVATGGIHPKRGGLAVDNITGDGHAIGFRAGADLTGMEFITTGHLQGWGRSCWSACLNMIQNLGAKFVNAQGERFMGKYDAELWERAKLCTLTQAFCKEALEGRAPMYCDMRHFTPEAWARMRRVVPRAMLMFDKLGIDLTKEVVELAPFAGVFGGCGDGGMRVNTFCETNIPGLYGAGAATKILPHGTYSVGGVNLAYCCVSGHRAGEYAARHAASINQTSARTDQVLALQERAFAPLKREQGMAPDEVFDRAMQITVPAQYSTFKNERRIREVLARLDSLKDSLSELRATNVHELVKAHEAQNYVLGAELVYRSALEREETRGSHYREEYPCRDDENWLKWIVQRRNGATVESRIEHIPMYRYPIKPESYGKKPHPVLFTFQGKA
ncbi:MAG: FAD-binding protein [Chloroflexi bacterium]|nr:FAD-binding protein [Chloroflexota bacterium]